MHLQFEDDGVRIVLVPGDPAHVIDGWYTIIDTDAVGTPLLLEYIGLAFDAKAHCIAIKLPTPQERGPYAWRMRYDPSVDAMAVYLTSRESLMRRESASDVRVGDAGLQIAAGYPPRDTPASLAHTPPARSLRCGCKAR
jgi:hypothetical protein